MPSVSHSTPPQPKRCSISEMNVGEFGLTDNGLYFFRCHDSAWCLNTPGKSYEGNAGRVTTHHVAILPPGTVLTITL